MRRCGPAFTGLVAFHRAGMTAGEFLCARILADRRARLETLLGANVPTVENILAAFPALHIVGCHKIALERLRVSPLLAEVLDAFLAGLVLDSALEAPGAAGVVAEGSGAHASWG